MRAHSKPMPWAAPVTTTTLPERRCAMRRYLGQESLLFKFGRPLSRRVKDAQDFQYSATHAIGYDIRCTRDHKFPRAGHTSRSSHGRMASETVHGRKYRCNSPSRGGRIVGGNILCFFFQVREGAAQPSNAHEPSTFFGSASLRFQKQTLRDPLLRLLS